MLHAAMAPIRIISWNVRGLNDKIKRSLVMAYLKKYTTHICILQETHLVGRKVLSLKKPWVGHYYHSTYSGYARGVSILIHIALSYSLLDVKTDSEGRYVLIHVVVDTVELLILGLYIPPTATPKISDPYPCYLPH